MGFNKSRENRGKAERKKICNDCSLYEFEEDTDGSPNTNRPICSIKGAVISLKKSACNKFKARYYPKDWYNKGQRY